MNYISRNRIPLLLLFLSIALFANTMDAERLYSWDDNRYLEENDRVKNFQVAKIFTESYFGGYMPMTLLSFAIEHRLWGLHPAGYHIVNLLFHAFNGLLVFVLLRRLTGRHPVSLIGAVLFIVHPVQVESVAWISERKNLLSMFFFLCAFLSHIQYRQDKSSRWQYVAWICYLLAALSKPIVVGAPFVFIVYDYFWAKVSWRRTIISSLPFTIIALFGAITILITSAKVGGIKEYWGGSLWSSLQLMMLVTWEYLVGLVHPSTLSVHYVYPPEAILGNWRVYAGLLSLIGFAGLGLRSLLRFYTGKIEKPMGFLIVLWVVAFMLPVSNIVPLSIQRADRFLYFPSVALFLGVGLLWEVLWRRFPEENRRYVLVGSMVAVAVFFVTVTVRLNQIWTNSGTLWSHHLEKYPKDDIAINNLAMYYYRSHRYPEALHVYSELARLTTGNFRPYLFMGLIAYEEERYADAIRYLRQALPLADTTLADTIKTQLIGAYAKAVTQVKSEGRIEDVVGFYHELLEFLPDHPSVLCDLGDAYMELGNTNAAMEAYQQAMGEANGYHALAHARMGHLLLGKGELDEAESIFDEGLKRQPTAFSASGKCSVLATKKLSDKALEACYLAVALSPDSNEFYEQLVDLLLRTYGNAEKALTHAERALKNNPELIHQVRGFIYTRTGQFTSAIDEFQRSGSLLAQMETGGAALAAEKYALADTAFGRVLANDPDRVEAVGGRCLALRYGGNLDAALPYCETAVRRAPINGRYQLAFADILSDKQRSDDAIIYYQKALDAGEATAKQKLAAAYYHLGRSVEASGLTGDAIRFYAKAILLDGNKKNYHNSIGTMFLKQRRFKEAMAAFDAAVRLDPSFALALANKGICAAALGEK
jgi:tetratricopeptide (TPR) repeat protein